MRQEVAYILYVHLPDARVVMSPEEQALFRELADSLLTTLIRPLAGSIFYGISLGLIIWAFKLFKARKPQGRPGRILAFATIACFGLTSIMYGSSVATSVLYMKRLAKHATAFVPSPTLTIEDQVHASEDHYHVSQYLILAISDAIVIWRAKALYPGGTRLFLIPTLCLVGSIACLLTGFVFESGLTSGTASKKPQDGRIIEDAGQILSLVCNLITTILVMTRLCSLRQWFKGTLPDVAHTGSPSGRKLSILVETGVAFCMVQAIVLFLNLSIDADFDSEEGSRTPDVVIGRVMNYVQYAFAANYSILVLILVHIRWSPVDNYVKSLERESTHSSSDDVELTTCHTSMISSAQITDLT